MKFRVEKNIPIVDEWRWEYHREDKNNITWPFKRMEVGDSFKVRDDYSIRARSAARSYARNHGTSYTCRRIAPYWFRVWRTK